MEIENTIKEIKTTSHYDFYKLINKVGLNKLHPYINIIDSTERNILLWSVIESDISISYIIINKYKKIITNDYIYKYGYDLLMRLYITCYSVNKKEVLYEFIGKCSHLCNIFDFINNEGNNFMQLSTKNYTTDYIYLFLHIFNVIYIKNIDKILLFWCKYKIDLIYIIIPDFGIRLKPYNLYMCLLSSLNYTKYKHFIDMFINYYGVLGYITSLYNQFIITYYVNIQNLNKIILVYGKY
jgi:hypothetical protein